MDVPARRRTLFAAVVVLVIALESLGSWMVRSRVDLIGSWVWRVVATSLLVGFPAAGLIERLVRSRDLHRDGRHV